MSNLHGEALSDFACLIVLIAYSSCSPRRIVLTFLSGGGQRHDVRHASETHPKPLKRAPQK